MTNTISIRSHREVLKLRSLQGDGLRLSSHHSKGRDDIPDYSYCSTTCDDSESEDAGEQGTPKAYNAKDEDRRSRLAQMRQHHHEQSLRSICAEEETSKQAEENSSKSGSFTGLLGGFLDRQKGSSNGSSSNFHDSAGELTTTSSNHSSKLMGMFRLKTANKRRGDNVTKSNSDATSNDDSLSSFEADLEEGGGDKGGEGQDATSPPATSSSCKFECQTPEGTPDPVEDEQWLDDNSGIEKVIEGHSATIKHSKRPTRVQRTRSDGLPRRSNRSTVCSPSRGVGRSQSGDIPRRPRRSHHASRSKPDTVEETTAGDSPPTRRKLSVTRTRSDSRRSSSKGSTSSRTDEKGESSNEPRKDKSPVKPKQPHRSTCSTGTGRSSSRHKKHSPTRGVRRSQSGTVPRGSVPVRDPNSLDGRKSVSAHHPRRPQVPSSRIVPSNAASSSSRPTPRRSPRTVCGEDKKEKEDTTKAKKLLEDSPRPGRYSRSRSLEDVPKSRLRSVSRESTKRNWSLEENPSRGPGYRRTGSNNDVPKRYSPTSRINSLQQLAN